MRIARSETVTDSSRRPFWNCFLYRACISAFRYSPGRCRSLPFSLKMWLFV